MMKLILLVLVAFAITDVYSQTVAEEPCLAWMKPQPVCPKNERYTCCKTCVEPTCRNPIIPVRCGPCSGGCICKNGYIRLVPGGKCVLMSVCRRVTLLELEPLE